MNEHSIGKNVAEDLSDLGNTIQSHLTTDQKCYTRSGIEEVVAEERRRRERLRELRRLDEARELV